MAGTPSPAEGRTSSPAVREDCWSAEATETLIEAWGERYVDLNRGNLRQKHWREVADAVNRRHGHRRTDIQCKNRIDTLKKKYKVERARVSDLDPHSSPWPFFARLHRLIGQTFSARKASPPQSQSPPPPRRMVPLAWSVPVGRRSKRPAAVAASPADDSSYFLRDHEDHAAAEEEDSAGSRSSTASRRRRRERGGGGGKRKKEVSFGELAQAIEKFGEIYERVEGTKQRQMIELEKQRMQFAMDLEYQRMQLFKDTQVELQKIKRARRSSGADGYS